jgi:predicted dehydrogenase
MKNKTQKRYSVLIIGAGRIGATFDSPDSSDVLTHAHAFKIHERFNLTGFVDKDFGMAQRAVGLWGGSAFSSLPDAFSGRKINVVSICVPDDDHFSVVQEVMKYPVDLIFMEKPLAKKLSEADSIIRMLEEKNIPVVVNYSRRFVEEFIMLKQHIAENRYGRFISGNGFYGKGILHNGTHMIDLLRFLLGNIVHATKTARVYDFYDDDPTVSAILKLHDGCVFTLNGVDCSKYTVFEMDMLFEKARVRLIDSGFKTELYLVGDSERFAGYRNLYLAETKNTGLNRSMLNAVEHIKDVLHGRQAVLCSAQDAYKSMEIALGFKGDAEDV